MKIKRLITTKKKHLACVSLGLLTSSLFNVPAQASLYDRGNGMIYDDVLNITWLQDANYAQTSGYDADGKMTWEDANTWAANLSYGGHDDWRLASANLMNPANPCQAYDGSCDIGPNNTTGEMGYMFYTNLGNISFFDTSGSGPQAGWGLSNTRFTDAVDGDTVSIQNLGAGAYYWLAESSIPTPDYGWAFSPLNGRQHNQHAKTVFLNAWAVRDGDVSAIPVPAAAWLFGSALLGLASIKRRK
jgi:hypothetical protein